MEHIFRLGRIQDYLSGSRSFDCFTAWPKHAVFVCQFVSNLATHGIRRKVNHNTLAKTQTNIPTRNRNFKGEHSCWTRQYVMFPLWLVSLIIGDISFSFDEYLQSICFILYLYRPMFIHSDLSSLIQQLISNSWKSGIDEYNINCDKKHLLLLICKHFHFHKYRDWLASWKWFVLSLGHTIHIFPIYHEKTAGEN